MEMKSVEYISISLETESTELSDSLDMKECDEEWLTLPRAFYKENANLVCSTCKPSLLLFLNLFITDLLDFQIFSSYPKFLMLPILFKL